MPLIFWLKPVYEGASDIPYHLIDQVEIPATDVRHRQTVSTIGGRRSGSTKADSRTSVAAQAMVHILHAGGIGKAVVSARIEVGVSGDVDRQITRKVVPIISLWLEPRANQREHRVKDDWLRFL